jgi:hypothetical protein
MVTLGSDKYLSFMFEPPERFRVDYSVAVALKRRTDGIILFSQIPSAGVFTPDSMRRETFLSLLYILAYS